MTNNRLLKALDDMAKLERFIRRPRIRGKVIAKKLTKKGNIQLIVHQGNKETALLVLKSHKERYKLAESLSLNDTIYAEGQKKHWKEAEEKKQQVLVNYFA